MFWSQVFIPFALGYFISQLFRSVNAVVFTELVREMGLDAWTVGLLTSAYFLAFACAQLPVGIALDRFGPRRTESALLLVAALGAWVFSIAETTTSLSVGRALIGLGVSSCLMGSFHAFVLWGDPRRLPFRNGAVMAVGAAGALTATVPVEWALTITGWRQVFRILALATVALSGLLYLWVPEKPRTGPPEEIGRTARGLGSVFRHKAFWSVLPLSVTHQAAYLSIQSLWAGPWLRDVAGLARGAVAEHLMVLAVAMGLGFIGLGLIAERLARVGVSTLAVWVSSAVVFQAIQLCLALGWIDLARPLWIGFGWFGAAGMLSYVIVTRNFPAEMAGRVNTGLNVFVFMGAFAAQAGIGAVVGYGEGAVTAEGGFDRSRYSLGFGIVLALQLASLAWLAATTAWRRDAPSS